MDHKDRVSLCLRRIRRASPGGFAIALHIKFATSRYLLQAYEKDWIDTYNREGLVMHDPTVRWGLENTGSRRWSALKDLDSHGVFDRAAAFGLNYGLTVAIVEDGSPSIASFVRADREFSDGEAGDIVADLGELHHLTRNAPVLTPSVHAMLRQMSIFLTHN